MDWLSFVRGWDIYINSFLLLFLVFAVVALIILGYKGMLFLSKISVNKKEKGNDCKCFLSDSNSRAEEVFKNVFEGQWAKIEEENVNELKAQTISCLGKINEAIHLFKKEENIKLLAIYLYDYGQGVFQLDRLIQKLRLAGFSLDDVNVSLLNSFKDLVEIYGQKGANTGNSEKEEIEKNLKKLIDDFKQVKETIEKELIPRRQPVSENE